MVAARALRVRGRDPEDRGRQVPQDGAPRAVRGRRASRTARRRDGDLHLHRAARRGRARHDRQPTDERALVRAARRAGGEIDALDADDAVARDRASRRGRAGLRRRRRHQGVPLAAREAPSEGGSARGIQRLGHRMDAAHTPFVAAIHGFCLGGGLELAMCCDVRVCADDATAGAAGDQARAHPRRRRHAAPAAARRAGPRDAPQPDRGVHRRGDGVRLGPRRAVVPRAELEEAALEVAGQIAAQSPHAVACSASSPARRATSARGGPAPRGGRRSGAACAPRTAPRAWPRSSRSARRRSPGADDACGITQRFGRAREGGRPRRGAAARAARGAGSRAGRGAGVVDVRAAGVNFADVLIRQGRYPQPPPLPCVPGSRSPVRRPTGAACSRSSATTAAGTRSGRSPTRTWLFDSRTRRRSSRVRRSCSRSSPRGSRSPARRGSRAGRACSSPRPPAASAAPRAGRAGARRRGRRRRRLEEKLEPSARSARQAVTYERARRARAGRRGLRPGRRRALRAGVKLLARSASTSGSGSRAGRGSRSTRRCSSAATSRVEGFYLGRFMKLRPDVVRAAAASSRLWSEGRCSPRRRRDVPARARRPRRTA